MVKPNKLPEGLREPAFSTREALERGASARRLRASDIHAPFHGVRSRIQATSVVDRCREYLPRIREGQFFSHTTAALLFDLPLPRRFEAVTDLHISARDSRPRTRNVVGHRRAVSAVVTKEGLPVTHPAALALELASILELDDLIIALDGLVRRKWPPTTLDAIKEVADARSGRGIRLLRRALEEVRPGTDSPMETRVRLLITRAGLPEPAIHHTIHSKDGDYVGAPDLAYVAEKIAIEYEGSHHRDDPVVFADDIERREQMQEADWYVIRVISAHVFKDPVWLLARIRRILAQRSVQHVSSGQ